ncbi:MAG: DUF3291 domain-containing protein [Elainellaceae cyanobacterium]
MQTFHDQADYHLAQINIGTIRAPLDNPIMADFVAQLDVINAIADHSPGFVWRLIGNQDNDATSFRPYDDDRILINLSVWESIEAFIAFVYRSQHGHIMRDRHLWFEKSDQPILALWWVPAGHLPTVEEAKARLDHLRQHGATPYAFSVRTLFPPEAMLAGDRPS